MSAQLTLLTPQKLIEDFVENLKNRKIDQKFFYLGQGAEAYYASIQKMRLANVNQYLPLDAFSDFVREHLLRQEINAFVSLGCGNAEQEVFVMSKLFNEGFKFSFYGVDSSAEILNSASSQIKFIPPTIKRTLVHADLTTVSFRNEIEELVGSYPRRLFAFLGSTFGNFNQTNITDSFYNLLAPGDLLWFDAATRPGTTALEDLNLFNRYSAYLKVEDTVHFWLAPLLQVGIPRESGLMRLTTDKEQSVGALKFKYSFVFSKKVVVKVGDEILHFLPGEKIDTQTIRVYHADTLINFFQEHNFELIKSRVDRLSVDVSKGQFLFKKNA